MNHRLPFKQYETYVNGQRPFHPHLFRSILLLLFVSAMILPAKEAVAQDFTFQFKNPGFGGHPANFQYFMNMAEIQKPKFKKSEQDPYRRSSLDDFERTLQRQLLNQLSRQLVGGELGDLDLSTEGLYDLGDFTIQVIPDLDVINVEILDQLSGDRTYVEIPRF